MAKVLSKKQKQKFRQSGCKTKKNRAAAKAAGTQHTFVATQQLAFTMPTTPQCSTRGCKMAELKTNSAEVRQI